MQSCSCCWGYDCKPHPDPSALRGRCTAGPQHQNHAGVILCDLHLLLVLWLLLLLLLCCKKGLPGIQQPILQSCQLVGIACGKAQLCPAVVLSERAQQPGSLQAHMCTNGSSAGLQLYTVVVQCCWRVPSSCMLGTAHEDLHPALINIIVVSGLSH